MYPEFRVALPLIFASLLCFAPSAARAQTPGAGAPADPAEASATVPPVTYRSPFSAYRGYSEQEIAPWRESNDTAGSIGGWRTYAREARQAEEPAKPNPAPGASPATGPASKAMPMGPQHKPMGPQHKPMGPQHKPMGSQQKPMGPQHGSMGPSMRGAVPEAPKDPYDAHQHH